MRADRLRDGCRLRGGQVCAAWAASPPAARPVPDRVCVVLLALAAGHRIVGEEIVASCMAWMGHTSPNDGTARYRWGDCVGWGIHEHGFIELDG